MFLLILFFAFTYARSCENINRDDLLQCFSKIDLNHDGNITESEIPSSIKPWFFHLCDINRDGILNLLDWNDEHACCQDKYCIRRVCIECSKQFNFKKK